MGQDEFRHHPKTDSERGLRYDHYSNFGGTANPRLGLIYHVFHPTTLKLLYGTAFRAPMPLEITPDLGAFYNNNLQLRPEKNPKPRRGSGAGAWTTFHALQQRFPQLD